ncbi:MAG: hypothetical protein ABWX82_02370 [Leifsonia sp.]
MTAYLYDLSGRWIAFRASTESKYLFDTTGEWIGWFPWGDAEAVTPDGEYLGTVVDDRLVSAFGHTSRGFPAYPGAPAYPGLPYDPGNAGYASGFGGYEDVRMEHQLLA